jgi:hypothetical protein
MEDVKSNAAVLGRLVSEKRGKNLIKKCTDDQLILLVELVLNIDKFGACGKKARVKKLQKINWKLKTARKILIKNFNLVKIIVSIALAHTVEQEICNVF